MAAAKKKKGKEKPAETENTILEEPIGEEVVADLDVPAVPDAVPVGNGVAVKKPLGVKEVIPFKWKLVGKSQQMTLTLFKAVEREDVEAQLERIRKEGYYTDLRILEADAKIDQPKPAGKVAKPAPARAEKSASKSGKARSATPQPATRKAAPARSAKSSAKARKADKPAKKSAKKK